MAFLPKTIQICMLHLLLILKINSFFLTENSTETYMSREEKETLKREAVDMFYHAYNAYMNNAYPADELMPLSCKGRYRHSEPSRGNVDDALGNYSLTLVDSLDTLVILGDFPEFERAVKLVIKDVSFDTDVVVSVFETNIRVLGGLLSAHVLTEVLKSKYNKMLWYEGELLDMAKDLGYRLLPAFNTTTGIPYGRVNLKYGMKQDFLELTRDTCTSCAGTMILEMAALSRLTGETIFEEKAHKTMDELWNLRHRTSNLMGTILNVHSGDWIRRDSGVGAGIDSYYEYCLKAYILLSNEKYLRRFNTHYSAIMTYVSQGPMLLDVHMHKPNTNSKNFMDALLAFWPGLQVLKGDLKPAIEVHEMLYQVMKRHKFIPEAFTADFQVHWGQHPLRPEFLESTYFLYRATGDHYYLHVGRNVLRSLQTYARVACGYASVKDVRTGAHDDSMDSFVLAETFKYLYLLFADPSETTINLDEYLFTTEGHFLPLSISRYSTPNYTTGVDDIMLDNNEQENDMSRSCVLEKYVGHILRQNLRNMVEGICPQRKFIRKLHASQFQSYNKEHVKLLNDMGITVAVLSDGRMQLVHNYLTATSKNDANEGVLFMQEMVELSKIQAPDNVPQSVSYIIENKTVVLSAGPANFGKLLRSNEKITGPIGVATPLQACESLENTSLLKNRIVIVERGECMFVDKARKLEKVGALGGIIVDNIADSSSETWPLFAMSGDGKNDVNIPVVFLFTHEAKMLIDAATKDPKLNVTLSQLNTDKTDGDKNMDAVNSFEKFKGSLEGVFYKPENVKQETSPDKKFNEFNFDSVHITIQGNAINDAIIIKNSSPNFYKVKQNELNDKRDENKIERVSYENIAIDNFKLKLRDVLRDALIVESKLKQRSKKRDLNNVRTIVAIDDLFTLNKSIFGKEKIMELLSYTDRVREMIEQVSERTKTNGHQGAKCDRNHYWKRIFNINKFAQMCEIERPKYFGDNEKHRSSSAKSKQYDREFEENLLPNNLVENWRRDNALPVNLHSLTSFVDELQNRKTLGIVDSVELIKKYENIVIKVTNTMKDQFNNKGNNNQREKESSGIQDFQIRHRFDIKKKSDNLRTAQIKEEND